ncbi:hypothetical protein GE09DRAFT_1162003 [Coniochaeta sp. 2T2.1]|nr:hypothetical protein GE09DRAFT_1162003 [Coniochaeta sp. 2T2.1]
MHSTFFIFTISSIGTAMSSDLFLYMPDVDVVGKRQAYTPPAPTTCTGTGDTCEAVCGPGYRSCTDVSRQLCYNPTQQETCCEGGTANAWTCLDGDYCLVDGFCCPHDQDPTACARAHTVTLPATYTRPTATMGVSTSAAMTTLPASASSSYTTAASTSVAVVTAAASHNTLMGSSSLICGVLAFIGNLL